MRTLLCIAVLIASVSNGIAETRTVTDCTVRNVQAAVNASSRGDHIYLNCSTSPMVWTSPVTITNKGLTIYGRGPSETILNAGGTCLFSITLSGSDEFRIHDLGITGTAGSCGGLEDQYIRISGSQGGTIWKSFRADHMQFTNTGYHAFTIDPWWNIPSHPRALFDHITFVSNVPRSRLLKIAGNNLTWREPDLYGTNYAIYIEDCTFTWVGNTRGEVMDTEHGVRMVVRHNTITNGSIQMHDTGSTPAARGNRILEAYNNRLVCTSSECDSIPGIGLRGGGAIVFNNTFSKTYGMSGFAQVHRATVAAGYLGRACNGAPVRACNTATYMHCTGGDGRACSGDWDCTGGASGACVVACESDSDCPVGTDGTATCLTTLDNTDGGNDASGYPCRDQTGRGQEYGKGGRYQSPSPVYWWRNGSDAGCATGGPCSDLSTITGTSKWFAQDRDFCYRDPSTPCGAKTGWTYTPYVYPHPWQTGSTVSPPSALRVAEQ